MTNILDTILSWFSFLKMNKVDYKKFENMTLPQFYHPILVSCFYRSVGIVTLLNSIIVPLMVYVIQTQSKKAMGNYKNLLIIQLLIDYIFNVVTFIFHPVLFWPMLLGTSNGIFEMDTKTSFIFFYAVISLLIWMAIIQGYSLFYRFLAMFQNTFFHFIYRNDKIFACSLIVALFGGNGIALVPFVVAQIDPIETRDLAAKDVPAFKDLLQIYPETIGFHPHLSDGNIYLFVNILAIFFFAFPVVIIGFAILLSFRLQTLQKILQPQTFAMHKMLHKAMLVQIVIVTLSFLTPIAILMILLFFEFEWASMVTPLCILIVHMHLLFESLNLLYFIKPYRVFVFHNILLKLIRRFIRIIRIVKKKKKDNNPRIFQRRKTMY